LETWPTPGSAGGAGGAFGSTGGCGAFGSTGGTGVALGSFGWATGVVGEAGAGVGVVGVALGAGDAAGLVGAGEAGGGAAVVLGGGAGSGSAYEIAGKAMVTTLAPVAAAIASVDRSPLRRVKVGSTWIMATNLPCCGCEATMACGLGTDCFLRRRVQGHFVRFDAEPDARPGRQTQLRGGLDGDERGQAG
jgi:hypothetical protein